MAVQQKTVERVAAAIEVRIPFAYGAMEGERKSQYTFTGHVGRLSNGFADVLKRHSRESELYVLYSYQTPMAWYSPVQGKWYFPNASYSQTTMQHQNAFKYGLRGKHVVILDCDENENVTESEQEFFSDKKK